VGSRSRYVVVSSAAAGIAGVRALRRARRRARLRRAAEGFVDAVMPSVADEVPSTVPTPVRDEAHAPGHQHLPLTGDARDEPAPSTVRSRPLAHHRRRLRRPGMG